MKKMMYVLAQIKDPGQMCKFFVKRDKQGSHSNMNFLRSQNKSYFDECGPLEVRSNGDVFT